MGNQCVKFTSYLSIVLEEIAKSLGGYFFGAPGSVRRGPCMCHPEPHACAENSGKPSGGCRGSSPNPAGELTALPRQR